MSYEDIRAPLIRLTCGEMSEAGWAERWKGWPGRASTGGTASSSGPGSGCAGTPGLWTTGSLCLCSERQDGKKEMLLGVKSQFMFSSTYLSHTHITLECSWMSRLRSRTSVMKNSLFLSNFQLFLVLCNQSASSDFKEASKKSCNSDFLSY